MEVFAHVQSGRLRIQTELLKCSKGDSGYHFIFHASIQDFIMAAILAVVEYLPESSRTKSGNDSHLHFPLSSLTRKEGARFAI